MNCKKKLNEANACSSLACLRDGVCSSVSALNVMLFAMLGCHVM